MVILMAQSTATQELLADISTLRTYIANTIDTKFSAEQNKHIQALAQNMWHKFVVEQMDQAIMLNEMPMLLSKFRQAEAYSLANPDQLRIIAEEALVEPANNLKAKKAELQKKIEAITKEHAEKQKTKKDLQAQTANDDRFNRLLAFLQKGTLDEKEDLGLTQSEAKVFQYYVHEVKPAQKLVTELETELKMLKVSGYKKDLLDLFQINNLKDMPIGVLREQILKLIDINKRMLTKNQNDPRFATEARVDYVEALETGLYYFDQTRKILELNENADSPSSVYLVASVFCTVVASVLVMPFVIAGSTIAKSTIYGAKLSAAFMEDSKDTHNQTVLGMPTLLGIMGTYAIGAVIGALVGLIASVPLMVTGTMHKVKKAVNAEYANKNDLLAALAALEKTIKQPNNSSFLDVIMDNVNLFPKADKHAASVKQISSVSKGKEALDRNVISDLKILFSLSLDEFEEAINKAKEDNNVDSIQKLQSMLKALKTDFNKLAAMIRSKKQDKKTILFAISDTLDKYDQNAKFPTSDSDEPRSNLQVGDYLNTASTAKEIKKVTARLRKYTGYSI